MKRLLIVLVLGAYSLSAQSALIDRGGGLIYDDVLDVTWLQDANYAFTNGDDFDGRMSWALANAWATDLIYYDSVRDVNWDDWRLPIVGPVNGISFDLTRSSDGTTDSGTAFTSTGPGDGGWRDGANNPVSEMGHMYYVNLAGIGECDPTVPYCDPNPLPKGFDDPAPFINLPTSHGWWTGTELPAQSEEDSSGAFYFSFDSGNQEKFTLDANRHAWAVRDGDVSAVPVPAAVWLFGSAIGLLGWIRRKAA